MLPFENVREQLLRAGIAPRHATRYVTELREHLADLVAQERASGLDARQADERALGILGTDAQLIRAMIDKGAPRSLAARAPWSVFAVLPVILLVVVMWATAFTMMHVLGPVRMLPPSDMPEGYGGLVATVSFVASYLVGPALAAGCITVALRQRVTSRWVWVGLTMIALFSGAVGFHVHVIPAEMGHRSLAVYSAAPVIYLNGHPNLQATLGVVVLRGACLLTVATIAYLALRKRLMTVIV